MPAPNLFLIGTTKGGSSTLAFHLASHPQIGMAAKEPNIFNQPDVEACRARLAAFSQKPLNGQWILDGSVSYAQHPKYSGVPQHIRALCPPDALRFVYMIRNPVDRIISDYFWHRERFGEDRPLREACTPVSVYLLTSRYDVQIRQFLDCFDAAQFRVIKHETYFANIPSEFADLCRWLEISDDHTPDVMLKRGATRKDVTRTSRFPLINRMLRANPGLKQAILSRIPQRTQKKLSQSLSKTVHRPQITAADRRFLLDQLSDSITGTERLTGLDLSDWRVIPSARDETADE
jgi:hypothetical protein